jgi:hypothetical protein
MTAQELGERAFAVDELGTSALLRATSEGLTEVGLYALAWTLIALGAARVASELAEGPVALQPVPTLIDALPEAPPVIERRAGLRDPVRDRAADRAIDRERVQAKRAQALEGDYFAVLGLDREASEYEISRAFARLSGEFAPQRFAEPMRNELAEALADIQEVLAEAHRVLSDATMRARYRSNLPSP